MPTPLPDPSPVDVCVVGAGLAGRLIAAQLRAAGVSVALTDPPGAGAPARLRDPFRLWLPCPPEHPHRLIAALGEERARDLISFLAAHRPDAPPLPLRLLAHRTEGVEMEASREAAALLGLLTGSTSTPGYTLEDACLLPEPPDVPILGCDPGAIPCELVIHCPDWQATDPFLADKLWPVREVLLPLPPSAARLPPLAAWHFSLRWFPVAAGICASGMAASGAREASPHLELNETAPLPSPRVTGALDSISRALLPAHPTDPAQAAAFLTGHACDNLPIVGTVPGRPRTLLCTGFGYAAATWAPACAAALVAGVLTGRPGDLPPELSTWRFC